MPKLNPYLIKENYKKVEEIREINDEVLSFEKFMKTYENDEEVINSYNSEFEIQVVQGFQYGSGKVNFSQFYGRMRHALGGKPTCKISGHSDEFDEDKDYAGMIVYAIDNKFSWTNEGGSLEEYKGRAFYVIIQCTNDWLSGVLRDVGNGRVHLGFPFSLLTSENSNKK